MSTYINFTEFRKQKQLKQSKPEQLGTFLTICNLNAATSLSYEVQITTKRQRRDKSKPKEKNPECVLHAMSNNASK